MTSVARQAAASAASTRTASQAAASSSARRRARRARRAPPARACRATSHAAPTAHHAGTRTTIVAREGRRHGEGRAERGPERVEEPACQRARDRRSEQRRAPCREAAHDLRGQPGAEHREAGDRRAGEDARHEGSGHVARQGELAIRDRDPGRDRDGRDGRHRHEEQEPHAGDPEDRPARARAGGVDRLAIPRRERVRRDRDDELAPPASPPWPGGAPPPPPRRPAFRPPPGQGPPSAPRRRGRRAGGRAPRPRPRPVRRSC